MRCCPDRETVGSPAAVPPRSLGPDRAGQQPAGDQGRGQDAGTRPDRSAGDGEAGERAGDTTGQDAEVPTSEPAVPPPAAQPMGDAQVHAIVVHTLDRLGRTVRDTLNLIHELAERGVGVRNLADPIRVDSSNPDDPMAQLSVVLLALFGQMERTYTLERAAHARAVATANGRRIGRPVVVDPTKLAYAAHLRDNGRTVAEIVAKTGIARTSLYWHLPPRPPEPVTAGELSIAAVS